MTVCVYMCVYVCACVVLCVYLSYREKLSVSLTVHSLLTSAPSLPSSLSSFPKACPTNPPPHPHLPSPPSLNRAPLQFNAHLILESMEFVVVTMLQIVSASGAMLTSHAAERKACTKHQSSWAPQWCTATQQVAEHPCQCTKSRGKISQWLLTITLFVLAPDNHAFCRNA